MTAPIAGALHGREHLLPVRVYYEDTDFTGVVYHGAYVRFFERGRTDFLRCVGVHHAELLTLDPPAAFVITRLEIDFHAPARIDDALNVRTTYERARGVRLEIAQRIEREGRLLCTAMVHAACIDLTGKPRRPPPLLKEKLAPFLLPSPPKGEREGEGTNAKSVARSATHVRGPARAGRPSSGASRHLLPGSGRRL